MNSSEPAGPTLVRWYPGYGLPEERNVHILLLMCTGLCMPVHCCCAWWCTAAVHGGALLLCVVVHCYGTRWCIAVVHGGALLLCTVVHCCGAQWCSAEVHGGALLNQNSMGMLLKMIRLDSENFVQQKLVL